jgi:hypothetical protein
MPMSPAAPELAVRSAAVELTALACAVRADWNADVVAGTLQRAAGAGMTWPQVLVALPKLMADVSKTPADLLAVPADPARIGISDHPVPASETFREASRRLHEKAGVAPAADDLTTRREAAR